MSVSIVMATYNGEKYIVEQLDSLVCQLSGGDEIVICDDCSKDDTVKVINQYIIDNKLDDLIKVHVNEHNLGFQNNFDKVMNLAENEYIFFCDQDDTWDANKISEMLAIMEEKQDCNLLCCDYEPWLMNSNTVVKTDILLKMPNNGQLEKIELDKQSIYIGQLGCCMCIRKSFRDLLNNYWFDGWAQDDRCWRMALVNDGLYVYHKNFVKHRIHDNNTATYGKYHTLQKRIQLFEQMTSASNQMLEYLKVNRHDDRKLSIVSKNADMMRIRTSQLKKRNILYSLKLIKYLSYYQNKKSFLVEIYLILRGR